MSELQVTFDGRLHRFAPGTTIRIGRSADNDIVVADPTVSRRHAQLTWQATGWAWQNAGQAPTFLAGQPVASFGISQPVEVSLGSPQGPVVRLQAAAADSPVRTELAADVRPEAAAPLGGNAPGLAAVAPPASSPGFAGPGQAPGAVPPQQAVPWQPGAQWAPAGQGAVAPQPGMPGAGPPGMPGVTPPGGPWAGQPAVAGPSSAMGGSFFQTLVPIRSWLHDPGWRQGLRLLIIPYALLPLIFLQLFSMSANLTTPGWAYSLYIAPLWLLAFWALIRPPQIGRYEIPIAVGVIIWTIIWLNAVTKPINDHLVRPYSFTLPRALIVGFNEETTKAIPVLVAALALLYFGKVKLDPRTWMLMGTIAGLTFGVVEQSLYTPQALFIIQHNNLNQAAVVGELEFVFRVFVDGFQHAVWAGVSGFFIGIAVNYRRRRVPMLLLGVSIPAVLHALNDWTLNIFSTVWVTVFLVQGLSLLLFLGYTLSASAIERSVRINPAFRGESMLMERFDLPGSG